MPTLQTASSAFYFALRDSACISVQLAHVQVYPRTMNIDGHRARRGEAASKGVDCGARADYAIIL